MFFLWQVSKRDKEPGPVRRDGECHCSYCTLGTPSWVSSSPPSSKLPSSTVVHLPHAALPPEITGGILGSMFENGW